MAPKNRFTDDSKKDLAKIMIEYCEYQFDDFKDFHEVKTGNKLNEEMFDEMIMDISC